MSYANGRLPASALSPIVGGRLRTDAAAAWNAMNAESQRVYGVTLRPLGPNSSYRTLAGQQYFWDLWRSGRGNLAAFPGTSNHGWGLAVDLANQRMRWIVDQIGHKYGWSKAWSDAPSEWWHLRYRPGVWKPAPKRKPIAFTAKEKRTIRLLVAIRKRPSTPARRRSIRNLKYQLRVYRKNIRLAAKVTGWNRHDRRRRYAALGKLYNG